MTELSIALVVLGVLAWDACRRWLQPRKEPDMTRVTALEERLEALATDVVRDQKVVASLAGDWKAKFTQIEQSQQKLDKDISTKVGGAIANLPSRGYNR